jgi:hypothetical protein
MVVGGPTVVLDLGGLRIVSDPTFDVPGPHAYLTKTVGPAVADDQLGPVDLVLISHDNHPDNLDDRGRAFDDAGLTARLRLSDHGTWMPLRTPLPRRAAGRAGPGPAGPTANSAEDPGYTEFLVLPGIPDPPRRPYPPR